MVSENSFCSRFLNIILVNSIKLDVLIIMGFHKFPKPDGKLNHSPYGKRQNMMVMRKKQSKAILLLKSPLKLYIKLLVSA